MYYRISIRTPGTGYLAIHDCSLVENAFGYPFLQTLSQMPFFMHRYVVLCPQVTANSMLGIFHCCSTLWLSERSEEVWLGSRASLIAFQPALHVMVMKMSGL